MANIMHDSRSDEMEALKIAKQQVDIKLQLLKNQYKDDISSFNDVRVEHIFKNSGAREYLERLKERTKIKDDIISNLREDLEYKNREIAELESRCKRIELSKEEYLKHWKDAQTARERLEASIKSGQSVKEQRQPTNRHHNLSSTSSLIDRGVPPPPPIDVPTIDEILLSSPIPQDINPYTGLDSSIPPPPPMDAPIDKLLQDSSQSGRAFEQERGQFLCHVYAAVGVNSATEVLGDIVELVEAEQSRTQNDAFQGWRVVESLETGGGEPKQFHVTLIRGHRVIYHHQIKALLVSLESEISSHPSIRICLDRLKLFYNHEKTKQFLCITRRDSEQQAKEVADLAVLKQQLRGALDQFATRMTEEDETVDTLAHCSLMYRDVQQVPDPSTIEDDLKQIEQLCNDNLTEYPISLIDVDAIHVKVGNRIHTIQLKRL